MSNFKFTDEQELAIKSLDYSAAVTAGAGAGKTAVLIARILNIVLSGKAEFSEIVAITFTDKAAAEMKVKLRRKAKEELNKNPQLRQILSQAPQVQISTIHSFCSSITRKFALELGLTPDYQILLEDEASQLLDHSIEEVIEDLSEDISRFSVRLLASNNNLKESLAKAYNDLREFGFSLTEAEKLTLLKWDEARESAKKALLQYIVALDKADSLKEGLNGRAKSAIFITAVLGQWSKMRPLFIKLSEEPLETITDDEWQTILGYLSLINDKTTINAHFGEIENDVKFGAKVIPFLITANDTLMLLQGIGKVLTSINKRYQELKSEKNSLDFIDLQQKALQVLKNQEARDELVKGIRYIMVDEYQDTNYLQQRIVDEIWQEKVNLFIVGDPKQSIYKFRGAEVALFEETSRRIEARKGKKINLSYNFRSELSLINFYNEFFKQFMLGDCLKSYAIPYESVKSEKKDATNCFHIVACPYEKDDDKLPPKVWQAKAITRYISEQVNQASEEGKVSYGDFAVLFPKRNAGLGELEEQFSQAGIPFVSGMGTSFFERDEIRDILSLLKFLSTPYDEISLAALLKGPFFNLDESKIYQLFRLAKENETHLYGGILLHGGEAECIKRERNALGITEELGFMNSEQELAQELAGLRIEFGYIDLANIIRKLIKKTQFNVILMGQSMGSERLANVEKLLSLIDVESERGQSNIEIVEYLKDKEGSREADAQVAAESSFRVRIMTVHASKGLEFKRVILAGINFDKTSTNSSCIYFDKEQGLISKLPNYLGKTKIDANDPRILIAEQRNKDEEEYEKQRLFYVAATRAEKELTIVVAGKIFNKNNEVKHPILSLLSWDAQDEKVGFGEYETKFYPYEYAINFTNLKVPSLMPKGSLKPVVIGPEYRALSPTALVQFTICPRHFYLEQRLKVPALYDIKLDEENELEDEILLDRQRSGTAIHHIFETARSLDEAKKMFAEENIPAEYYPALINYFASEFALKGESEVGISLHLPEKKIRLIGIADRIIYEKDKITVVDFKSQVQTDFAKKAKEYELQLAVYALALKKRFAKEVEAIIYFPTPNKIYQVNVLKAEERLYQVLDEINQVLEAREIPPRCQEKCSQYCQYLSFCHTES